jgi:hypothetical protein
MGIINEIDKNDAYHFWFHTNPIEYIKTHNMELPKEKRLEVSTIDINHSPFQYLNSLQFALRFLPKQGDLTRYISRLKETISTKETYIQEVRTFKDELIASQDLHIALFGKLWYERLLEMTTVEIKSHEIRNSSNHLFIWKRDKSREQEICSIVDSHIENSIGKILVNVGANHAQKSPLRGTKMQWLGEHLHATYPTKIFCMLAIPAEGTIEGNNEKAISLFTQSPKNELFYLLAKHSAQKWGYLPLNLEEFEHNRVVMNFHYDKKRYPPSKLYDGVIVYPKGTYVNPFP